MHFDDFQSLYRRYAYPVYREVFEKLKNIEETREVVVCIFMRLREEDDKGDSVEERLDRYRAEYMIRQKKAKLDSEGARYREKNNEILGIRPEKKDKLPEGLEENTSEVKKTKEKNPGVLRELPREERPEPRRAETREALSDQFLKMLMEEEDEEEPEEDEELRLSFERFLAETEIPEDGSRESEREEADSEETEGKADGPGSEDRPEEAEESKAEDKAAGGEPEAGDQPAEAGQKAEAEDKPTEAEPQAAAKNGKSLWLYWLLFIIVLLLFAWFFLNILMSLGVLPVMDLGYSWFNSHVVTVFPVS